MHIEKIGEHGDKAITGRAWLAITIESRNYTPPTLLCMLALGKTGEGTYARDSDIYIIL